MRSPALGRKALLPQLVVLALGTTAQPPALAQDGSEVDEVVVVTGSRIVRRDFTAQTPIVTLESESFLQRSNIGLEATLNQLPQFHTAGTQAQGSPASTPFPGATAAPGAATLNLRGLGLNRSLVLVNGRRVQPVNGNLVVDLNTIPSAAIDRVEVITGGAAAVYGADAIAGVVNFILKSDFEGLEFRSQFGVTQEGDGEELSVNALFGTDFADGGGNVMIGADYSRREIIYGRDRDWIRAGWTDPGTVAGGLGSTNLSQFVPDPANAAAAGWFDGRNYFVDQNGALFDAQNPQDPAHPYTGPLGAGAGGFRLNPDGSLGYNDAENSFLQLPLERYSIFGNGHIELADNIELFTEMRYSETVAEAYGALSGLFNVWTVDIPYNPLYDDPTSPTFGMTPPPGTPPQDQWTLHPVPAELAALLNSRNDPSAPWTYAGGIDWLPPWQTITTSNVYQIVGGLRGDVSVGGRDWFWNAFASHGKTSVLAHQPEGFPYLPRVQNLFTADQYGRGFNLSQLPNYFPLSVTGDCTSGLPIFNPDGSVNNTPSVSQDCNDYVTLRMNTVTRLTQDVIEANLSGALAELPAGEVLFAIGAGTREETFNFDPDSGYNANQDYPNVVQNIILPVTVAGSTDVTEIFGEMAIPLVSDRLFVQSFELDPGFRFSDYSSVGSEETYKLLFDWTVNDRLRFRGGKQVATRAPNIAELFTPKGGSEIDLNAQDPCGYWPTGTQSWGNRPENPNRTNLQLLCQELMVRDGAPPSLYEPGGSADAWAYNVFGATTNFPFSIAVTQGNPNLDSETADTYTFGLVLGFDQWTLALDWYEIELEQAIGIPGFAVVYQQCMDPQYNPLLAAAAGTYTGAELAAGNQFCDLINREYVGGAPLTEGNFGAARNFDAAFINQGGVLSQGVDVQFDWGTDFDNGGLLSLSVLATILDKYAESAFPGAEFVDLTGTEDNSSFDYRTFTTLNYARNAWSVGLRWEHMPSLDTPPGSAADRFGVESYDLFDLFSNWQIGEGYMLRAGIDNLLDKDPVVVGRTSTDNNLGSTNFNYDPFGRRFYVGLSIAL